MACRAYTDTTAPNLAAHTEDRNRDRLMSHGHASLPLYPRSNFPIAFPHSSLALSSLSFYFCFHLSQCHADYLPVSVSLILWLWTLFLHPHPSPLDYIPSPLHPSPLGFAQASPLSGSRPCELTAWAHSPCSGVANLFLRHNAQCYPSACRAISLSFLRNNAHQWVETLFCLSETDLLFQRSLLWKMEGIFPLSGLVSLLILGFLQAGPPCHAVREGEGGNGNATDSTLCH